MTRNSDSINILVAGGSGLWAEKNHNSSILGLKSEGLNVKVVGICDPINPRNTEKQEVRDNLQKILELDNPEWVDTSGKTQNQIRYELDKLNIKNQISAVIVATDPVHHYFYCEWALRNKINLLCDKPLVTNMNSSLDIKQAQLIQRKYEDLNLLYDKVKKENKNYMFCSPLRRRALTPFIKIADGLNEIYLKTGEGIRYMNVIINGGIHKYPSEYLKGGAHGHIDGVGTLSHTSYHFIDVVAWYLKMARENIDTIEISMPYILRVKEYIKAGSYKSLRKLVENKGKDDVHDIPEQALNTELDFHFYLKLRDKNSNQIGLITFIVNYSTFAPRLTKYNPEVTEYAHDKYGGRMSSVYFDIHQGALQQWQLIKNDEVALGHNIDLRQMLHPLLGEKSKKWYFTDAYETGTLTSKDLFKSFIKSCAGEKVLGEELNRLSAIDDQKLTIRIYSMMYEKIAEDFYNKTHKGHQVKLSSIIKLDEYFK